MKFILLIYLCFLISCNRDDLNPGCLQDPIAKDEKINGASTLQTWKLINSGSYDLNTFDLKEQTSSNYIALCPLMYIDKAEKRFPLADEIADMKVVIQKTVNSGFDNILLKPLTNFWTVDNSTFWGDFYVENEEEWLEIETEFSRVIFAFAELSRSFDEVKMLCIGNELSEFTKRRPGFFVGLAKELRRQYPDLKLTYAANWDEYYHIDFWNHLDYIGVNPYFPLLNSEDCTVDRIQLALANIKTEMHSTSCTYNLPVLFTEYGYRSMDYGTWKGWQLGRITSQHINYEIQSNAYEAFFNVFWDEPWVAGGFFWEWKMPDRDGEYVSPENNGWYINNKPAQAVIKAQYEQ